MGHVRAKIKLSNPRKPKLAPSEVTALVDTGAMNLCIPRQIMEELRLEIHEKRSATTADGRRQVCPYVGPVQVDLEDRTCFVGALVMGDEVLLGAIPLEDMDLMVSPLKGKLIPNPKSNRRI
jgi:clan AA aspartic protease